MFKLQRLEITGFKSFAEYTEIIFTGDGITAVVGPNGCGKSNISDAITWVLGEQRVKNLRGGEMQDVIFAGAKARQPSGMAEVVLHLVRVETDEADNLSEIDELDEVLEDLDENSALTDDEQWITDGGASNANGHHLETNGNGFHSNQSEAIAVVEANSKIHHKRKWKPRRAALEFAPGEAVSVTRRLYRSGESDYLLNGRACRLRDIQDLFAGTGLSGGHYALIQQEKISQILSAKPSDRRQLIEEAAGVTKFRTRQRAAEIRLESAKTNLRRISDIVSEVDKQAASLRRQAARTRRYKEIGQILRELLSQVLSAEGRELSSSLARLGEKLAAAAIEENRLSEAVHQQAVAAQTATAKARQAEDALAEIRQAAAENALRRERINRDFAHQTEQVADLSERVDNFKHEIKTLNEQLAVVFTDRERLREKNQQQSSANETESVLLLESEENYQKQLAAVRQIESEVEKNRQELFRHTTAAERFREIIKQQTGALDKLAERAAGLEKEGIRAEATHKERQNEFEIEQVTIKEARQNLQTLNEKKQNSLETVKSLRDDLQTLEKLLSEARAESNKVNARRAALEKLDDQNSLLEPAVQKLFAAQDKIGVKPLGTVADFIQVEAKYEKAVEAVLGALLQSVVIENAADVWKISDWLKTSKAGKLNLLVNELKQSAEMGDSDSQQNLAQANDSDSSVKVSEIIGAIDNLDVILPLDFRIVENLIQAAQFSQENCVTLAGEIVSRNRFFVIGQTQSKGGILGFKRELRELATRAKVLKTEFEKAELDAQNAHESLIAAEHSAAEIQTKFVASERDLMSVEVNAKSLQQEIERAARHTRIVADERERLETERIDLQEKQLKTEADQTAAEAELKKTDRVLDQISSSLAQARERAESANQILSEHRAAAAAANERRRSQANALKRVEQEHDELTSRIKNRSQDLSVSTARLAQINKSLVELKNQRLQIESEKERDAETIAAAIDDLARARALADQHAAELSEANAAAARAKDARAILEVNQAETTVKLQNLSNVCQQELNQNPADLPPAAADFDLPEGKRKLAELREKLEGFGAVNLLALEELSQADERLLFLTSQRKDIVDGIAAAENALEEIKHRSRERFEKAFNEINRNFTALFSEIFGGGRGEMNLLEAADVLESGVEIVAQPPGKRLQNLLLLSGGEKALTAIALVLAIFRFRPAPFCLLDEVDAPLDEANVGRFVKMVREMSEKIQFIVITHNKRTMEAARALYGVTMEEAGISKIVSVKFD